MSTIDRRSRRRDDHSAVRCCHPTRAVHTAETALLAALVAEHKLVAGMLDYPDSGIDQILGFLDAHDGAAKNLDAWVAAGAATS